TVSRTAPARVDPRRLSSGWGQLGVRAGQSGGQLLAIVDPELGEHFAQMPFHGARAEEEPCTDLRVRQAVPGQLRNLPLLRRQIVARLDSALAYVLACGQKLFTCALG